VGWSKLAAKETEAVAEEEEEEEEGLFRADAVNEEDPERDRATRPGGGYSARVMLCNVRLHLGSQTDTSGHPPMHLPPLLPYPCIRESCSSLIGRNDTCHFRINFFCTTTPRDTCMFGQFASLSPPPPPPPVSGELEGV